MLCVLIFYQVSDWWEEYIYLRSRGPIVVNSNYYGMVCPHRKSHVYSWIRELHNSLLLHLQ